MRTFLILLTVLALSPLALDAREGEDEDTLPEVGRLFVKECLPCHRPPDPAFEVDRAWLDQIDRTA